MNGSVSGLSFRKLYWEARNELISANAVTIFIVESLLKAVHDCIERVQIASPIIFSSTRISVMIRLSFAISRNFIYRLNKTMFFDNLPLEMTCSKCGKQINETVKWLKAESRKCPFCNTLIDTTEFRRGIDEATNRTHEMLRNLQESLKSVKIKIKL